MLIFRQMNNAGIIEITGLLRNKVNKKISFSTTGLAIEKPGSFSRPVFIPSQNLNAFRYGIVRIRSAFIIGWHYFIEIQDDQKKITSIRLNSYYGIRTNDYYHTWKEIIHQLWGNYFVNIFNYYYELYQINQTFELCSIRFHHNGISWDAKNILLWHEIGISNYATYFMIYNIHNKKQYKSCNFARDWNAVILQSVLKMIAEEKKVVS